DPKAAPGAGFGTGLAKLIAALNTDFDWLREHTRYLQRATEWDKGGRPANRLLSGNDIAEARAWAVRRPKSAPEPTALHLDFIRASEEEAEARSSAQRKQLEAVGAAQAERETALRQAEEALKQAADAQRKRAKIRNIAFLVVSIFAVLAGWLYWNAEQQRKVAEAQREQADRILSGATKIISKITQIDVETQKEVFALFKTGADRGDKSSMAYLGLLYHTGFGVPQDYAKAREWFEKADDKGDASAQNIVGVLYANGQGVAQDYDKAREWFEKGADKGNADAMFDLGILYTKGGQGLAQDYAKAREWFEKAADRSHTVAMTNLGALYAKAKDYVKAREWYEKAADKGNADAKFNLALRYEGGQGGPEDDAKAREWFEKAADKGDERAKAYLEKLAIRQAVGAGRYAGALQLQEALAAKVEAAETERKGNPGEETAQALNDVAGLALLARESTKAVS